MSTIQDQRPTPSELTLEAREQDELLERWSSPAVRFGVARWRFRLRRLVFLSVARGAWVAKRLVDVTASGLALLLFMPCFLGLAALIRLDSPGPILFGQVRVGRHGRTFRMWKFRSMYVDAEARKAELAGDNETGGVIFKMKRDPRITRIGRFIRKASIDELPQLWNVFIGDMSLVGPRPPVPAEVAEYTQQDRRRLEVRPGITCIWQVSGRSDIPFDQQVELDAQYVESRGLLTDISLLLKTIPAVLLGRGAY